MRRLSANERGKGCFAPATDHHGIAARTGNGDAAPPRNAVAVRTRSLRRGLRAEGRWRRSLRGRQILPPNRVDELFFPHPRSIWRPGRARTRHGRPAEWKIGLVIRARACCRRNWKRRPPTLLGRGKSLKGAVGPRLRDPHFFTRPATPSSARQGAIATIRGRPDWGAGRWSTQATPEGVEGAAAPRRDGRDVVVKASGVGYPDDLLLRPRVMAHGRRPARRLRVFWDVDAAPRHWPRACTAAAAIMSCGRSSACARPWCEKKKNLNKGRRGEPSSSWVVPHMAGPVRTVGVVAAYSGPSAAAGLRADLNKRTSTPTRICPVSLAGEVRAGHPSSVLRQPPAATARTRVERVLP